MEIKDINLIPKPKINQKELNYIKRSSKNIYINLYEIKMKKPLKLYNYPFTTSPKIENGDIRMRKKLFRAAYRQLKSIYSDCFISGNSLFSINEVNEIHIIKVNFFLGNKIEYSLTINNYVNERIIKLEDIQKDQLTKYFIEMIIKNILDSSPKLEFYKGIFVLKHNIKTINTYNTSIEFNQGISISFIETDKGNFLKITLKNKIMQNDTILDYINNKKYMDDKNIQKEIKDELIGKSFKVSYLKKNHIIEDILFDRNPKNQTIIYEGATINLIDYYTKAHLLQIKDVNQPIILVKKKDSQGKILNSYFIPELCFLCELNKNGYKDYDLMREVNHNCNLNPVYRIEKINEFIELLMDNSKEKYNPNELSSKEKSEVFGIEIKPLNEQFIGYYLEETKLLDGKNKIILSKDRFFPVYDKKINNKKWLYFYEKSNYHDAVFFYKNLSKASKAYDIKISEPEWIEISSDSSLAWINKAEYYFSNNKNNYSFVIFLIKENDILYKQLKQHSLCKRGYVSQVVKIETIRRKN